MDEEPDAQVYLDDSDLEDESAVSEEVEAARAKLLAAGLDAADAAASVRWLLQGAQRQGDWQGTLRKWVQRRAEREPVQYILGSWPFYPLKEELLVRPPVLIPRPETEELVDNICRSYEGKAAPRRIVDFGSGSGAIVISLLHTFRDATAVAVEPSPFAAALTAENAARCGVANRLAVTQQPAGAWAAATGERAFDLLVSNPPYIPSCVLAGLQPEVRRFEDHGALDGGEDGLDVIVEVLMAAKAVAGAGARLHLELHHTQPAEFESAAAGGAPERLARAMEGLMLVRTARDVFGQPRFAELQAREGKHLE